MGNTAYFPFIIGIILTVYCSFLHGNVKYMVPALEMTLPAMSAWWSIFLLQDSLEEEGSETLFTYPSARWILFLPVILFFFVVYTLFIMILLFTILIINNQISGYFPLLFQLGIESFFFVCLGFLSMVLTRNVSWALYVIAAYTSFQIITKGVYLPSINIYIFNDTILPLNDKRLLGSSIKSLILSFIIMIVAQTILNKTEKFK